MSDWLAALVCTLFVALAFWHFFMALAGGSGESAAVPSVDGKPLFVPTTRSTLAVGIGLLAFAALVAATSGMLPLGLPAPVLACLSYTLALGLLARAVGEFKYLGFFKKVRNSRFAKMDTLVYSPLCLLLSAGVAAVALQHAA